MSNHLIEHVKVCEYFRSRSFLYHIFSRFLYVLCFTRSRDQVSVYRTISPLVRLIAYIRPLSSFCPPFSKIVFSENPWPIKAKFYVEPPWEGGTKVCINGPGHMTKMATMSIYGKPLKKSSSPEPEVL